MSKTPYEIRLELLKLANEILTTPVHSNRESAMQEFHSSRTTFEGEEAPRNPLPFPTLPEFPTTADIVEQAEELKKFVDGV